MQPTSEPPKNPTSETTDYGPRTTDRISGRRGTRTLTPLRAHGLANRPGQPYPAALREEVAGLGLEPRRRPYEGLPSTCPPANAKQSVVSSPLSEWEIGDCAGGGCC